MAETQRLQVPETLPEFDCLAGVAEGDYVYVDDADNTVKKAKADSMATMPAFGKVVEKISSTRCTVDDNFIEEGLSGVLTKTKYYISKDIAGTSTINGPTAAGHILQPVAFGVSTTQLLVKVDPLRITVRS